MSAAAKLARFSYGTSLGNTLAPGALEAALTETRKHGLSRSLSQPIPRIDALCAPVFDADGHIVLGILVMGPSATFDSAWDGAIATPLKHCALEVSRRIGKSDTLVAA